MAAPTISVVIPIRNESHRLMSTIRSISDNRSTDCELEIIIVDDASTDNYCSKIAHNSPGLIIRVLRLAERVGVPIARNRGANIANGEILFMTDSHVFFCQNWDRCIIDNINDKNIIAATIADTVSSFRGYGCSLVVPFMGTRWNKGLKNSVTGHVQIASSAGTALNKQLFLKIGGYDSGMILYGAAEPEFSVRAWLSGAEIISVSELVIHHRFKLKNEIVQFLKGLKPFMIHNSLRFGLLYLSELGILQMIRYYTLAYPTEVEEALRLVYQSDVWERRSFLEENLIHDFCWFVNRFDLKDQTGQEIV